jgi:hypothetical protein
MPRHAWILAEPLAKRGSRLSESRNPTVYLRVAVTYSGNRFVSLQVTVK